MRTHRKGPLQVIILISITDSCEGTDNGSENLILYIALTSNAMTDAQSAAI